MIGLFHYICIGRGILRRVSVGLGGLGEFLVVRIGIEIEYRDRLVRSPVIVSSGYETEEPEIHISN